MTPLRYPYSTLLFGPQKTRLLTPLRLSPNACAPCSGAETVLAVQERTEGHHHDGPAVEAVKSPWGEFRASEAVFSKDGILLAPAAVLAPLLRFAAAEMKRRLTHKAIALSPTAAAGKAASASASASAVASAGAVLGDDGGMVGDLADIVGALQRSENHLLAVKVGWPALHWHAWMAEGAVRCLD